VVRQRPLARHRHVAPTDQPHIGEGVMGGVKRPGRDQHRAIAREAGNAMDARGVEALSAGHCRQDGGEPPGQPPCAGPRGAKQQDGMGTTPASASGSPLTHKQPTGPSTREEIDHLLQRVRWILCW
jgi:hypothetical protein